jgi:riboflavin synthase
MFTGIIENVGHVAAMMRRGVDVRMQISTGEFDLSDVKIGDSIAVSGVCLTVIERAGRGFAVDVSGETLARTTLEEWQVGTAVNLEKALLPTTRLGGHLVSGHVDGVGVVRSRNQDGGSTRLGIEAPKELARYIAEKGSICVDGTSLTVNAVNGEIFDLNIIAHTAARTTIAEFQLGRRINLEVDILARYLERLLLGERVAISKSTITRELLERHGFLK